MDVAVVVPWRSGCPHRQAALESTRARWPWPVVLGEITGEWCKARAVATAVRGISAAILVVADADVMCSTTPDAVDAVRAGAQWAIPHRGIRRLSEAATAQVLAGADPAALAVTALEEPPSRAHRGGGIVVLRRDVWDRVPMDPRFVGWGLEDDAWGMALWTLAGPSVDLQGRLWHLWHPPQERPSRYRSSDASRDLFDRYAAALHKPGPMGALIDEAKEAA